MFWGAVVGALVLFASIVAVSAAPVVEEQLVEGHTVYTLVQMGNLTAREAQFAAAVVVLIQEVRQEQPVLRFPGVLWFNDQYLVNPSGAPSGGASVRYPCKGAVIAVPSGSPDPRPALEAALSPLPTASLEYLESYLVTDPVDHTWTIDKWLLDGKDPVWAVALLNNPATRGDPDDGSSCPALHTTTCNTPFFFSDDYDCLDRACGDDAFILDRRTCMAESVATGKFLYNALLLIPLDGLLASGAKDHAPGSDDYRNDVDGCHGGSLSFPCPGGDDDREGNSHPYNPGVLFGSDSEGNAVQRVERESVGGLVNTTPIFDDPGNDGEGSVGAVTESTLRVQLRTAHGGSANCDGVPGNDLACHMKALLDIYYGVAPEPTVRSFREGFVDLVGSAAPYHCERQEDCLDAQPP